MSTYGKHAYISGTSALKIDAGHSFTPVLVSSHAPAHSLTFAQESRLMFEATGLGEMFAPAEPSSYVKTYGSEVPTGKLIAFFSVLAAVVALIVVL